MLILNGVNFVRFGFEIYASIFSWVDLGFGGLGFGDLGLSEVEGLVLKVN